LGKGGGFKGKDESDRQGVGASAQSHALSAAPKNGPNQSQDLEASKENP